MAVFFIAHARLIFAIKTNGRSSLADYRDTLISWLYNSDICTHTCAVCNKIRSPVRRSLRGGGATGATRSIQYTDDRSAGKKYRFSGASLFLLFSFSFHRHTSKHARFSIATAIRIPAWFLFGVARHYLIRLFAACVHSDRWISR